MLTLLTLYLACSLHGMDGRHCMAVGAVESGYSWRGDRVSSKGCRGLMQTCYSPAPVPLLALTTTAGSAWAGAEAIRYWQRHRGAAWARGYACGWRDGSRRCWRYEAAVKRAMNQIRRPVVGQPVT